MSTGPEFRDYEFFYKWTKLSRNVHRYTVVYAESEDCAIRRFKSQLGEVHIVSITAK